MKQEYYSHHVNGVSFTGNQPTEFFKAILLDFGWVTEANVTYLASELARIRGEGFSNGDALLASMIMVVLDKGIPDPHDVDLPQLTSDLLDLFYEQL